MTHFTHQVEDVFDDIRGSNKPVTADLVDLLLSAVDTIKAMLAARASGEVYESDDTAIVNGLRGATGAATGEALAPATPSAGVELSHEDLQELREAAGEGAHLYAVRVSFDESNPMNSVGGIQAFAALKQTGSIVKTDPDFDALYSDQFHPVVTYYLASEASAAEIEGSVALPDVTMGAEVTALAAADGATPAPPAPEQRAEESTEPDSEKSDATEPEAGPRDDSKRRSTPSSSVLRVDSRRVDNLLNLVSETVINKASFNQVSSEFADAMTEFASSEDRYRSSLRELFDSLPGYLERMQRGASSKDIKREINERFGDLYNVFDDFSGQFRQSVTKFRSNAANLGRITGELQEGVMRIRMVPVSQIFSRFPRLVRDLTRSLNKKLELVIEGEDTELDKSVIEDLLDPLIHCVRNSIDHGIENPADRQAAGKQESGTLTLRASNEGNMIIIEISDDGRGIDVAAVRQKAIDRGVIHPSKALSDLEAFNLIFDPGFSTAQKVSNISGRGVGLDVVKKQIEKLNGTVTVWSAPGEGTTFTMKIPLTLAIIQGLMVRVGPETYAIPITAVVESHRIKPDEIRLLDNHEVLNVRDDVISLLRLSRIFRIRTNQQPYLFVVIVGSGDKKVGLVVDSLIGEEDVVIKPLRDRYTNAPGIAGANITGDGRVSLIIDVAQLLELGLKHERDVRSRREAVIGG